MVVQAAVSWVQMSFHIEAVREGEGRTLAIMRFTDCWEEVSKC